ncbi:MAG: FAD-binding protein [Bacteroidetes bacterium]|nr:FAD-binding protein [Bacteroidota bacterium]
MIESIQIKLLPEEVSDLVLIKKRLALEVGHNDFVFRWKKRSIDARKKRILINATFEVAKSESEFTPLKGFQPAKKLKGTVHIIGAGPAGLFAALRCIEFGLKPIVIERGKDVRARRRDLAKLNKEQIVNPESNYCFGEGGAGTYSDGKLYTRSKKRGDVDKTLALFVEFGAPKDILIDAHPHIGTNKLPQIIVDIREKILLHGGEVRFESKLTDIEIVSGKVSRIQINSEKWENVEELVLATGHSARDIFDLLHRHHIKLYAKPFALGVRVEHLQEFIDKIQYHGRVNDAFLPPSSYSLVTQVANKGVFSFCMCPGGIIAPCATEQEEVVTNGWSPSKRNNPYSNSGIVVTVSPDDFENSKDPMVCLDFQKSVERACWEAAGKTQEVPAQCLKDFIDRKVSKSFPRSSYQPGIVSVDLNTVLPKMIADRLRKAFLDFDKKMKGFVSNDAVLHAPESRTSSPIQIPRDRESFAHIEIKNLYPCAEGAGYAGGIISAAIDGMKVVEKIAEKSEQKIA